MRPDQLIPKLLTADPARPRVTFYDDTPGPTKGERIELSAKVLTNWVNKAANLLQEEFDAGPGTRIALRLPAAHWRTTYWAFAAWAVGATVIAGGVGLQDADVVIDHEASDDASVIVTLAALARQHPGPVGAAVDEARELATYADRFHPWQSAADDDPALVSDGTMFTFATLVAGANEFERRYVTGDLTSTLRQTAAVFGALGSVLLVRHPDGNTLADRLVSEGVTVAM